ncbi:hypothetical protein QMK19_08995 [Streptomyces sp. H10-C2]|uniref:hypothetical protein n=1 Tax=unclassified Streptomyces TaxID=2593676 RepID=UPI0024BA7D9B|nr:MULTISPECIES: hypothetical protein [unclassified Streptomyces]MDJ0340957.1 hypothetical protein [Streptomyces sp. PH10-H1]MDJ0369811.1 hypothetical protein [Streptomyces sp. H10-C2]
MPLSQMQLPHSNNPDNSNNPNRAHPFTGGTNGTNVTGATSSHRSRRRRRHAGAVPAGGRRAVHRPPLLSGAAGLRPGTISALVLVVLISLTVAGNAGAFTRTWEFLDYGAGVLSLVSLTGTVLWGLAATDRLLLHSSHRLLAQGVHRGLATAGFGFLALHIWVKVQNQETSATAAGVPFTDAHQPLLIGLGTLAGYLFLTVAATGAVRSAFASGGRSHWWRALHMGAYPAWGASLVHGLKSGRPASGWVTVAYALCLAGVAVVLAVRLRSRRRGVAARRNAVSPPDLRIVPPPEPEYPPRAAAYAARQGAERMERFGRRFDAPTQQFDPPTQRFDSSTGWRP